MKSVMHKILTEMNEEMCIVSKVKTQGKWFKK